MRRIVLAIILAPIVVALLGIVGVGGALALENQDSFCATCHTEPELTYVARSHQDKKVDLASYHTSE